MANVVTYVQPAGAAPTTPPTAAVMRTHQEMFVTITGDAATSGTVTITHNWGISAADNTSGWPAVEFEPLLAGFYTAVPTITTRTPNTVVITVTAFAATAGVGVRIRRIWSALR